MRRLIGSLAFGSLFGLLVLLAVPASAQGGPCVPVPNGNGSATCTVHLTDAAFPPMPVAPNVCPDGSVVPAGLLAIVVENGVVHITVNKALDEWDTSTLEGTFDFVAADTQVEYTGHFAQWFGDSLNNQNFVSHATINFVGSSATGSTISLHLVAHFATDANGDLHVFFMTHC